MLITFLCLLAIATGFFAHIMIGNDKSLYGKIFLLLSLLALISTDLLVYKNSPLTIDTYLLSDGVIVKKEVKSVVSNYKIKNEYIVHIKYENITTREVKTNKNFFYMYEIGDTNFPVESSLYTIILLLITNLICILILLLLMTYND